MNGCHPVGIGGHPLPLASYSGLTRCQSDKLSAFQNCTPLQRHMQPWLLQPLIMNGEPASAGALPRRERRPTSP